MAELLKGAPAAAALTEELKLRAEQLAGKGVVPTLAIVRVGANSSDLSYERGAVNRCAKIGINVVKRELPEDCTENDLIETIESINNSSNIHGCLIFRPLPRHIIERDICELLSSEKDVDGITSASLSTVFAGSGSGFAPCTAQSCIELLKHYGVELAGKKVTVIGRSLVIGRPVSMLLMQHNATVTMCHTGTADIAAECRNADIIIAAAGKAGFVDSSFVRPGQVVIDVGINVDADGNLCGDVKFNEVEPIAAAITPVPGGVGSMTTAVLAKHVIEAAEKTLF